MKLIHFNLLLTILVGSSFLMTANGFASIVGSILQIGKTELDREINKHTVTIRNHGPHHAQLWCASADDVIGDQTNGLWVAPGDEMSWSFKWKRGTQFWCTLDWNPNKGVHWDVYVWNWEDAPRQTIWNIRSDGIYDDWKNRKWRDLNSA